VNDDEVKLETYRVALQARNLEINLFWQRSNYFLVLNTAIAIGFFSRSKHDIYELMLSLVGALVAFLWIRVNLGSKFWQARWERRLHISEETWHQGLDLFSASPETIKADVRDSLGFWPEHNGRLTTFYHRRVLAKPSVTKSMTGLSVIFAAVWIIAAAYSTVRLLS
jgi:hypothetical protein